MFCTKCGTPVEGKTDQQINHQEFHRQETINFNNASLNNSREYHSERVYENPQNGNINLTNGNINPQNNNTNANLKNKLNMNLNSKQILKPDPSIYQNQEFPMGWYKAIVVAVIFVIMAYAAIWGIGRVILSISAFRVGAIVFGIFEMLFAVVLIVLAIGGLNVRNRMIRLNANAYKLFIIWFDIIFVCNIILNFMERSINRYSLFTVIGTTIVIGALAAAFSLANYLYFKKREHLFCN